MLVLEFLVVCLLEVHIIWGVLSILESQDKASMLFAALKQRRPPARVLHGVEPVLQELCWKFGV